MMQEVKKYWPLIVLFLVAIIFGGVMSRGIPPIWMHASMGFALIMFATLKLFNPSKFADGFQMYDMLAKNFRPYAYVYPLIELALGFAWAIIYQPYYTAWATIVIFSIGLIGVLFAIHKGLNVNCACMGNVLQVPLSTVTVWENMLMITMSIIMLNQVDLPY